MSKLPHNLVCLAIALFLSWVLAPVLSVVWSEAFINDRTFHVYWQVISVGTLLRWLFLVLFFFASGLILASTVVSSRPWAWSLLVGACYSLYRLAFTSEWFAPDAEFYVYLSSYGEYTMPLIGAMFGALASSLMRHRINVNVTQKLS